eukprot:COSAG03_NODE_620_length_6673_cov_121.542440_7_plen_67_part_00
MRVPSYNTVVAPLCAQIDAVFHSSESREEDEPSIELQATLDEAKAAGGVLEQTYRRAPLEEALRLL